MHPSLFHEIYGVYFAIVKEILSTKEALTTADLDKIIRTRGFGESILQVLPSLQNQKNPWFLLRESEQQWLPTTKHAPQAIQTTLERRWLKTVTTDPRLLFFMSPSEITALQEQLKEEEPLFDLASLTYYDQFNQIDSFVGLAQQQAHFKELLTAIQEKACLKITYQRRQSAPEKVRLYVPFKLEYSPKNNLFRVRAWRILRTDRFEVTLNLDRIHAIQPVEETRDYLALPITSQRKQAEVTCVLIDKRQALKRSMSHFADYHKTTRRLDENRYQLTIQYHSADETELLIRLLSFGPFITVTKPDKFVDQLKQRLNAQARWMENWDDETKAT
ncbi:hypothetical protein IGI37_002969 [Enterococcus sp. AZ194]|uniref:WYL domain-containing protein n=1 Tax=Enterococcus sp. AZ194 TaxID=2774629 RepID=UPI003F21D08E